MGAHDNPLRSKLSAGFIPKEKLGQATSWEFESLVATDPNTRSAERLLTDREQRAYDRGHADGVAQTARLAQEEAARARANHTAQIDKVLADLRTRFAELETTGADQVLDLAIEIARHVVRHDIASGRDALLPVVREAVAAVIDQQTQPRVRLNPADFDLIAADLDTDHRLRHCQFLPDAQISRGGCRIETASSEVDASIETRWSQALAALGISDPWRETGAEPAPDTAAPR
ncbi:MAG: flagellar assembly protein FliH [Burkholderiaceae bacterium]